MTAREEYTAGLRALADLLDGTPELPLPSTDTIEWAGVGGGDDVEHQRSLATIARLIPGRLEKNDPREGDYEANYYRLTGNVGGMPVEVWAQRAKVCRRVVTGTREVVETVPAPGAPMVEVTKTVEDVEWVCEPLLAKAVAS
jgi:hypothetical protein